MTRFPKYEKDKDSGVDWLGGLGVSDYEGIVSPDYSGFRLIGNNNSHYLGYLYRTNLYLNEFGRNSTGVVPSRSRRESALFKSICSGSSWPATRSCAIRATTSQMNLNADTVGSIRVLVPPVNEQKKITTQCHGINRANEAVKRSINNQVDSLKSLRSTLIAHAVTGKIKVN